MLVADCAGKHVYDVGMMGNGALAGLVAITSGTSTIYPWGALIVGFVAGAWYCLGSQVSIWLKVSSRYISSQILNKCSSHRRGRIGFSYGKELSPAMLAFAAVRVCLKPEPPFGFVNNTYVPHSLASCRRGLRPPIFLDTMSCCVHAHSADWTSLVMQWDDPLDAIAVHAWNGLWGVIAVGMFAAPDLITNSYGTGVFDGAQRPYGFVFSGSDGHLLVAQIAYALFITSTFPWPL